MLFLGLVAAFIQRQKEPSCAQDNEDNEDNDIARKRTVPTPERGNNQKVWITEKLKDAV
jgi:hypothetical protein